jgi:hypothetical protein
MCVFGNHQPWLVSVKLHLSTLDVRISITFEKEYIPMIGNPFMISFEYGGWNDKILKVDYRRFQIVVLPCN